MREWVKVVLGVLALSIGASAPTLIIESVFFRSIYQAEHPRDRNIKGSDHEPNRSYSQNQASAPASPSAEAANAQVAQRHTAAGTNHGEQNNSNPEQDWVPYAQGASAIAAVLIACVVAGINFAQWGVYNRQARIMRRQLVIARMSARAAETSADISRRILTASHRAWIHVTVNISNQPARFDKNGAGIAVSFVVKNVGTVPAINITEHAWLVLLSEGDGACSVQIQQRKCDEVRRQPFHPFGFTLFPDETSPESIGIEGFHALFVDRKEIEKNSGRDKGVSLHVVGCVDYTFPADADNHHQTGFIYQLIKSSGPFVIGEDEGRIPPSDLQLIPGMLGMGGMLIKEIKAAAISAHTARLLTYIVPS